jgi:glucose/arabinose dehydrogenase
MSCSLIANLANAYLAYGYCAYELPVSISQPRGIVSLGTTDLLALERATNSVVLVKDTNGDGIPDSTTTLVTVSGLNHGLAVHGGFLYASSDVKVWRWPFNSVTKRTTGAQVEVVRNINADGNGGAPFGHTTRTLAFDASGRLYIAVGSNNNVDDNSYRARIRRFSVSDSSTFPLDFAKGEVFADGLRNEVGLAFDKFGILWGVENSADRLFRSDLGGDIHNDNPAEELNRFDVAGRHYGYPYCWTEFKLPQSGVPGKLWAWPSFMDSGLTTDAQCRANYVAPEVAMQAHSAPLGITFYAFQDTLPPECTNLQFPKSMDGFAFIAHHGSWNRDVPTGYKVVFISMNNQGRATSGEIDLLKHVPPNAKWEDGFRPVDVAFDTCGRLLVSSDGTNGVGAKIVRIEYKLKGKFCFSGHTKVEVKGRGTISMADLQLGDEVLVSTGKYDTVYSFGHREETAEAEFLQFLPSGLEISMDHMLKVGGRYIPASKVEVGDELETADGHSLKVETIQVVLRKGVYAPFTMSGTILVSNIKASSYVAFQNSDRLILGGWTTPLNFQWLAYLSQAPHRLWIRLFGVERETYTRDGMSEWIDLPYGISEWYLRQNFMVELLLLVPILTCLTTISVTEAMVSFVIG